MATSLHIGYIPATFKTLGGGLNSTSGSLNVDDSEASDLQNIDLNKFGSILKRNGYSVLNNSPLSGSSQGLHWYQGLFGEYLVTVNHGKLYKMDNLDGSWDDVSGALTIGGSQDSFTKLLLHMDGPDQGTTFADSETTAKSVFTLESYDSYTVLMLHMENNAVDSATGKTSTNTNVAFSNSVNKFGTYSGSFTGSSSYLTFADSADWAFGSGDFTVDMWVNVTSISTKGVLYQQTQSGSAYFTTIDYDGSKLEFAALSASSYQVFIHCPWVPNFGNWEHLAISRNGNNWYMFVNGVSQTVTLDGGSLSATLLDFSAPLTIGGPDFSGAFFHNGYIDEYRVTKGFARWTSSFTPWKAPYGLPSTITSIKKLGTASGEIKDGGSLYLTTSTDWSFSTSNFTVDMWVNFNNLTNAQMLLGQWKSGTQHWYIQKQSNANGNKLQMVFVNTTSKADYTLASSWPVVKEEWHHIAFIRSSTAGQIAIDGVFQTLSSTTSFGTNDVGMFTETNLTIGVLNSTTNFSGYMDELRISKGINRWTSNFTPGVESFGSFLRQDMVTFLGFVLGSDPENTPWSWAAQNTTATNITVPTGLTGSMFIKKFQNYCFLGNVKVAGIRYPSRVYWSAIQDFNTWNDAEFIDISKDDGQEITGIKELADRLVIYKNNSIYVIIFTGDADIPFIVQKTNSAVGCSAPFSIQASENGHIFAAYDGIYFFDGVNSYKLSDRINETYAGVNHQELDLAASLYQHEKNKYWISLPSGSSLSNNIVLTWDSFLNAWSKYDGISATSLALALVDSTQERPYFGDNLGYYYRADNGSDDYPSNTRTAINSYFYTNWKYYDTLCDKKGFPHVYISHRAETNTTLTLKYSYDFFNGDQFTQTFSAATTLSVTSLTTRRDLNGRGRFVRLGLANNQTSSSFRIDGIGTYVTREGLT